MQRRFRSCERFGKRSVVPCYSYDSRGRQDRPESAERMQEPIKRGGSDAGTDLAACADEPSASRQSSRAPRLSDGHGGDSRRRIPKPINTIQIMLRNQLSAAVESAAQELGYGFRQGFEYRMAKSRSGSRPSGSYPRTSYASKDAKRERSSIAQRCICGGSTADTTSKPRKDNGPRWNATRWL